ncbi:hypothetical protein IE077_000091 [Cardiosporidium cionae]|uniref:Sugar phosphate transporter domain-containing protein n=1 Tax=Cardiosporidium cionae TaxID=476202 RepID=A0ABQ7JDE6_9APIC|nr:hypothetical protein IE077_000091 [Cardiosporidium cionae]|eukprot:KAF8822053.1 hypothetical protein IE077_000091 [Cardiosporidium cionae]
MVVHLPGIALEKYVTFSTKLLFTLIFIGLKSQLYFFIKMLRSVIKLVLLITPFHIFLSAIWSFLLHPIILIIFCHQLTLLQASYLNPFFITSEVRSTFGILENPLKPAISLPTFPHEAPPVHHSPADVVTSSLVSSISIPTVRLSNNVNLLQAFAKICLKLYRQRPPPTLPPLPYPLIPNRPNNAFCKELTSNDPDLHLLGSPFSIAFYPFSHSTLPPPRQACNEVWKEVIIRNHPVESLLSKFLRIFGIIHAFGRTVEVSSTRNFGDISSGYSTLDNHHPSLVRKQRGLSLQYFNGDPSVFFLFNFNGKTRGYTLSESNTCREFIRKTKDVPSKIKLWSNDGKNRGRKSAGENKFVAPSVFSEISGCSNFLSPPSHIKESTVSALSPSVRSYIKTSETRQNELEPKNTLEVELSSGVAQPSLSSLDELENVGSSRITDLKSNLLSSPAQKICLVDRKLPFIKHFHISKETVGVLCKTVGKFSLWYFANCQFSIQNKHALMLFPLPFTVSLLQTAVGIPLAVLPWVFKLRKYPYLYRRGIRAIVEQGFWHTGLHLSAMCALCGGAVGFVSVVKASEPVMTALLRGLVLGKWIQWRSYLSLIPIIVGVILASAKELSFTWSSFSCAMLSNVCSTLRSIKGKEILTSAENMGKKVSPQNLFALTHLLSCFMEIPFAVMEIPKWRTFWKAYATKAKLLGHPTSLIFRHVWLSGLFYFLYNELALSILNGCTPISHAVANALKRICVVAVSAFVFRTRISFMGASGSCLAVAGTFIYSLTKGK